MKQLFVVFLGLLTAIGLRAENYPYRSDYLWVTVPNHAVWNLLKCEKESLITPVNEHWTSDVTNRQQLTWILSN